jgi:hypothetical protein
MTINPPSVRNLVRTMNLEKLVLSVLALTVTTFILYATATAFLADLLPPKPVKPSELADVQLPPAVWDRGVVIAGGDFKLLKPHILPNKNGKGTRIAGYDHVLLGKRYVVISSTADKLYFPLRAEIQEMPLPLKIRLMLENPELRIGGFADVMLIDHRRSLSLIYVPIVTALFLWAAFSALIAIRRLTNYRRTPALAKFATEHGGVDALAEAIDGELANHLSWTVENSRNDLYLTPNWLIIYWQHYRGNDRHNKIKFFVTSDIVGIYARRGLAWTYIRIVDRTGKTYKIADDHIYAVSLMAHLKQRIPWAKFEY